VRTATNGIGSTALVLGGRRSDVQCDPLPQPVPAGAEASARATGPSLAPAGDLTRQELQKLIGTR
jgi:hypothetical protein